MTDYSKNIYCETWETGDGYRIDIAWTWYEMKKMPYKYRYEIAMRRTIGNLLIVLCVAEN